MQNNKCCVTFITHKSKLDGYEEESFKQCIQIFSKKRPIKLIVPNTIDSEYYNEYKDNVDILKVNHGWLDSLDSYNCMYCDKEFWELFIDYEYVLIYQTDCWVFEDRLDYFIDMGYDWYGAPWSFWGDKVGNSGLCLRKVSKMLEITKKYPYKKDSMHDDVWFCKLHRDEMNICPWEIAVNFSLETTSLKLLKEIKNIPMGFHGKNLIKLWDKNGKKFKNFKNNFLKPKKISIVTINLNNKNGLKKTIESVISQTYFDEIEYIIIDGGSADGSLSIIGEYVDYFSYCCSETDNGIFDAMNKGVEHCHGEYTLFLNSGDYLYSNKSIEDCYNQLQYDIVYGNEEKRGKNKTFIFKSPDVLTNHYFKMNFLPHQSTFIKTSLLKEKKYTEKYKLLGDWVFFKEAIIDNNATYKHIENIISSYDINGVSSNYKLISEEKNKYYLEHNKNGLDIFICTHKEFELSVKSDIYKIINSKGINPDLPLKDDFYSELYQYKYVADSIPLKKYIGFCHYRRYFKFLDDIPDMDEIFKESDAVVAKPIVYKSSVKQQYANCHNIEDLYIIGGIIADKYPEDVKMWHSFINGKIFLPYNMFIMRREDFKDYIVYVNTILDEYLKIVGTDIRKRIENNKDLYLKKFYPNNTVDYQYRVGGYIAERLTNLFILSRFKKLKAYPVIVTENKYRNNEKTDQD